eukprot:763529-Hanusia_phi.AAC.2
MEVAAGRQLVENRAVERVTCVETCGRNFVFCFLRQGLSNGDPNSSPHLDLRLDVGHDRLSCRYRTARDLSQLVSIKAAGHATDHSGKDELLLCAGHLAMQLRMSSPLPPPPSSQLGLTWLEYCI